jgi:hypothetical protein
MPELQDLLPCEHEVTDPAEKYFRQCHPSFVSGGQPSSQFLGDFPRDEGMLSGTRSSKVSATVSYLDYVKSERLTAGTWGVPISDIHEAKCRVIDDTACPQTDPPRPQGHAYLDFRGYSQFERKAAVSELLIRFHAGGQQAVLGGWGEESSLAVSSTSSE